jgi:hypothetical protein
MSEEVSYEQLQALVKKLQIECDNLKRIVKSAEFLLDQYSTNCAYCRVFLKLDSDDCEYGVCYECGETLCQSCYLSSDFIKCEDCDMEVCRECTATDSQCKSCYR